MMTQSPLARKILPLIRQNRPLLSTSGQNRLIRVSWFSYHILTFFSHSRQIIFSPDVPIRLDYQGKRVDMTHGPLAGMLMGLAQLNCSEIRLKRINHRYGILGFDKLALFLLNEWASDIKKNQLPSLLGGVGPMYSFVQLCKQV